MKRRKTGNTRHGPSYLRLARLNPLPILRDPHDANHDWVDAKTSLPTEDAQGRFEIRKREIESHCEWRVSR